MKVTLHVPTVDDIPAARAVAEANLQEGDELEIIVGQQPLTRPAETQPIRQAVGHPAQRVG